MISKDVLAKLSLFEGLPDGALEALAGMSKEVSFAPDVTIFSPEQPSEYLYVLVAGSVRLTLFVSTLSGPVTVTSLKTPGQAFGFSAVVGKGHHHNAAEASSEAKVIAVDGRALMDYLEKDPSVGFVVMKRIAGVIVLRLAALRRLLVETINDYERPASATAEN
jgi:CRP-like cAMP-binding protein